MNNKLENKKNNGNVAIIIIVVIAVLAVCAAIFIATKMIGKSEDETTEAVQDDSIVSKTYVVDGSASKLDMKSIVTKLQLRADEYFENASVVLNEDNSITITLPNQGNTNAIFTEVTAMGKLVFMVNRGQADEQIVITGDDIESAKERSYMDDFLGQQNVVDITFTHDGTTKFAKATQEYIGQKISIVLDDKVVSEPTIVAAVTDGRVEINNLESADEAKHIAALINAGSLDVTLVEK